MLESDSSMHRGQRGLAGRRLPRPLLDLPGADGDQTYRLATRRRPSHPAMVSKPAPTKESASTAADGVGVFEVGRDARINSASAQHSARYRGANQYCLFDV